MRALFKTCIDTTNIVIGLDFWTLAYVYVYDICMCIFLHAYRFLLFTIYCILPDEGEEEKKKQNQQR